MMFDKSTFFLKKYSKKNDEHTNSLWNIFISELSKWMCQTSWALKQISCPIPTGNTEAYTRSFNKSMA